MRMPVAVAVLAGAAAAGQHAPALSAQAARGAQPATTGGTAASAGTSGWRTYGGDLASTRYAPLDQIDRDNFGKREVAWRFKTDNLGPRPEFNFQSTPLMVDGVLIRHDIWDWDLPCAPVLADVMIDGRIRKIAAQPSKQGWLYVLDRETGEPIWPIEERAVERADVPGEKSHPTQLFVTRPPPFERQGVTIDLPSHPPSRLS